MSTKPVKKKKIPNIFNKLRLKQFNDFNNSFHEIIDAYSDQAVRMFEKAKEFKEIVPDIKKGKRTNFLYKRLVYKGMKFQSPFMKALMKMIKKAEEKNKLEIEKREFKENYKMSLFDIVNLKRNKLERFKKLKLKELNTKKENSSESKNLIRSFSNFNSYMNSKTPKIILNSSLNDSNYSFNNNNKNLSMTNKFSNISSKSPNNKEFSTYYKSDTNFKNISLNTFNLYSPNNNKANYLIDKCLEEIDSGNSVADEVHKASESFSKNIKNRYKTLELMNKSKRINLDTLGIKKYKKLEINNLNEIKRKLNEKISDTFAFQNRKRLNQQMKNSESTDYYYIYLHEMEKTNERLDRHRREERKKIKKLENLCEEEFKKKEYLKKRIDIINRKHRNAKKIQDFFSDNNIFLTHRQNIEQDKNNKGFLANLLMLRDQKMKEATLRNIFNGTKKKKVYG